MRGLVIEIVTPETEGVSGVYAVREFTGELVELQAAVGGWVEAVPSDGRVTLWVNEEGKLDGLPVNRLAMDVWLRWDVYGCVTIGGDWLAGNVVVTGGVGRGGRTLDLPAAARGWVLRVSHDSGAEFLS